MAQSWYVNPKDFTQVLTDGREDLGSENLVATVPMGLGHSALISAAQDLLDALKISQIHLERIYEITNVYKLPSTEDSPLKNAILYNKAVIDKAEGKEFL